MSQAIQQIFETPIMLMRPYCVCEYLHVVELHVQFGWVHLELSSHLVRRRGTNLKPKKKHTETTGNFRILVPPPNQGTGPSRAESSSLGYEGPRTAGSRSLCRSRVEDH